MILNVGCRKVKTGGSSVYRRSVQYPWKSFWPGRWDAKVVVQTVGLPDRQSALIANAGLYCSTPAHYKERSSKRVLRYKCWWVRINPCSRCSRGSLVSSASSLRSSLHASCLPTSRFSGRNNRAIPITRDVPSSCRGSITIHLVTHEHSTCGVSPSLFEGRDLVVRAGAVAIQALLGRKIR